MKKKDKKELEVHYYDNFDDDFAGNGIVTENVPEDYVFVNNNIFWRIGAWMTYHLFARPLLFCILKIMCGFKVEGRKNLRGLGGKFFLYGNHTTAFDGVAPATICKPHKTYIICNPDATSINGLKTFVKMCGAIPIPNTTKGLIKFNKCVEHRYKQGCPVAIFPEAHIWPFCNFIRTFPATSFLYPAKLGAKVVVAVTTYRDRKGLFKNSKRPGATCTILPPIEPNMDLPIRDRAQDLCDRVYKMMVDTMASKPPFEYVRYIKRDAE